MNTITFRHPSGLEEYNGNFIKECWHGEGSYKWINFIKFTFEGYFYANYKDGYGTVSYPDGSIFQGLFKENMPFGPGVVTYPNGFQDVGLWMGEKLIRLATNLGQIPLLATTDKAKIKLLSFRRVVDVKVEDEVPKQILRQLGAEQEILKQSGLLYSDNVKHKKSLFFNKPYFDYTFFNEAMDTLPTNNNNKNNNDILKFKSIEMEEVAENNLQEDVNHVRHTDLIEQKPVFVLAWNNGDLAVSLLQHAFIHHKFEEELWFSNSHIIEGEREHFHEPGELESICKMFLERSINDDVDTLEKLLRHYNLDPDVSDASGNTAVIYATNNNNCEVIEKLMEFNSNVNIVNDEGLTPLSLAFLKYVAVSFDILDWSHGFLLNENEKDTDSMVEKYMFDLTFSSLALHCETPEKNTQDVKKKKSTQKKSKKKEKQKEKTKDKHSIKEFVEISTMEEQNPKLEQLKIIEKTIMTLLMNGADPNAVLIPIPGMFLALFSGNANLLKKALEVGGSPNIQLSEEAGNLSLLHAACLLPPTIDHLDMVDMLLTEGADPNVTSTVEYALPYCNQLRDIENMDEDLSDGLNPLQLLCMRPDVEYCKEKNFLGKICVLLANTSDSGKLFLGHSPLSMAIAGGNVSIVKHLLTSSNISPNQLLHTSLGTALTVLLNPARVKYVSSDALIQMMDILIDARADPLTTVTVGDFIGTPVQYALNNLNKLQDPVSMKNKKEKKKKKGVNDDVNKYKIIVKHLINKIQEIITKHIQNKLLKTLIKVVREKLDDLPSSILKAKYWFDCASLLRSLQIMVESHMVKITPQDIQEAINLIENKEHVLTKDEEDIIASITKQSKQNDEENKYLVGETNNSRKVRPVEPKDEGRRYKLCFQCGKSDCDLIACPKCGLVYYCSLICQQESLSKNIMTKTEHRCFIAVEDEYTFSDKIKNKSQISNKKPTSTNNENKKSSYKANRKDIVNEIDNDFANQSKLQIANKELRKQNKTKDRKSMKLKESIESITSKDTIEKKKHKHTINKTKLKDKRKTLERDGSIGKSRQTKKEAQELDKSVPRRSKHSARDHSKSSFNESKRGKSKNIDFLKKHFGTKKIKSTIEQTMKNDPNYQVRMKSREPRNKSKEGKSKLKEIKTLEGKSKLKQTLGKHEIKDYNKRIRSKSREMIQKINDSSGGRVNKKDFTVQKKTLGDVIKEKVILGQNKFDKKGQTHFENQYSSLLEPLSFIFGLKNIVALPYIVLQDGNLYYKFYSTKQMLTENYSLI